MQQVGRLLLVAGSTILQMAPSLWHCRSPPFCTSAPRCSLASAWETCCPERLARHRSALTEIVACIDCAIANLTGKNGGQDCTGFEQALRDCDVHETDEELRNYLLHGAPVPVVVARVTGTG